MTGSTSSSGFPSTPGAFDPSLNDGGDAFVVKLNPAGSGLVYATFVGGMGTDDGYDIALSGNGSAYVTGRTSSSDFPTTPGAFDPSINGAPDAFVAKLNPAGNGLDYATFLGGSGLESGLAIALDGTNSAYVTGWTVSSNFPTTPDAFDTSFNGWSDGFVAKVDPGGSGLNYATFLGGNWYDEAYGIAVDGAGSVYVTGQTSSSDFPTTPGAFNTIYNTGYNNGGMPL